MANDDTINIDALLQGLGFTTPAAAKRARRALEAAGVTRPGKRGIAAYKRGDAFKAIASSLVRVCGDECASLATDGREPVVTPAGGCEVCEGSNNRRAALACLRTLRRHGITRVLVVGGTATQQHELRDFIATDGVDVAFVDGTSARHSQKEAVANMNRAQLLVIWGSTPLRHAVSNLYTTEPPRHLRSITVSRRGIEAVCREIIRSYEISG
jgi:hypothetical protein